MSIVGTGGIVAIAIAAIAGVTALAPVVHAQAPREEIETVIKEYLARNPEEVQRIVREYLIGNPDVLREAIAELVRRRQAGETGADRRAAIKANADKLFRSPLQVTLGNPQGDVTLVEFFDYNCSFCKRALADKLALMGDDPNLRVVLKELPILGADSVEAAHVSIAVRMQDPGGSKFFDFHQRLLSERGRVDGVRATAVAKAVGLDMARLVRDVASDEVRAALEESTTLARALGINGTPSYVIGEEVVAGAAGVRALKEKVQAARK